MTSSHDRQILLALARSAIRTSLEGKHLAADQLIQSGDTLPAGCGGVFVTLKKSGELRGCIGRLRSEDAISDTIVEMARSAAFQDPRFPPLQMEELDDISIEISRLSEFFPIHAKDVIVGKHGLFLTKGGRSGLLLPQVPEEQRWNREEYLSGLCRKAGVSIQNWDNPDIRLEAFTAEVFGEVFDEGSD